MNEKPLRNEEAFHLIYTIMTVLGIKQLRYPGVQSNCKHLTMQ
jgi:hypothetical protein